MNPIRGISVAALFILGHLCNSAELKHVNVEAAYGYNDGTNDYLYLLAGDSVQVVKDKVGQSVVGRAQFHIPEDMEVTGAFTRGKNAERKFYGGEDYGVQVSGDKAEYFSYAAFPKLKASDAAGNKGDDAFAFKGCEVGKFVHDDQWVMYEDIEYVNVGSIGLPCNVNAAWREGEAMVVLKGAEFWRWEADGSVNGPHRFDATYQLTDNWSLE